MKKMKIVGLIPARIGSQRLKKKNLQKINGKELIRIAVEKCIAANCFDEIWINSDSSQFKKFADNSSVFFYKRREELGNNAATSEDYIYDFLSSVDCDYLIQVHSIAPLLSIDEIRKFTSEFIDSGKDTYLSFIEDQIEVMFQNKPINFTFNEKTNSQDLEPLQRITWSITGWNCKKFLASKHERACATYSGDVGFFKLNNLSSHVIKTQSDLEVARLLFSIVN